MLRLLRVHVPLSGDGRVIPVDSVALTRGADGRHWVRTQDGTCLAAHALPPEYAGRADDYIAHICDEMLPALAAEGLVDAVDVFCERIAFTLAETSQVFQAAQKLGIPVKLHAEQLSDMGGSALAARFGALSCDHIEHLSDAGIAAMKQAGTVAVLLPGAYYFLRDTHLPPIAALRAAGVPMAVSTDHNPGTSPTLSLLLMLNMACTLFRLTVPEAVAGVTRHAARALGLQNSHGQIAVGQPANFVLWPLGEVAELVGHDAGDFILAVGGQHQAGIFRQQQQFSALPGSLFAECGEVLDVGIPGGQQIDVVLAGGNLDHEVSSFNQNDMGLADSSASSRSRQWYWVCNSG